MFLPYRLLSSELSNNDCTKSFLQYRKTLEKLEKNRLRVQFITSCLKADIIPRFLKFRIPNNGAFDEKSIFEFQKGLLRKELFRAKQDLQNLNEKRRAVQQHAPVNLLPSIAVYTRLHCKEVRRVVKNGHKKKKVIAKKTM